MNGGTVISHGFRAQLQNLDSLTKHSKTWNQLLERAYAINSWANLATFLRHMGLYPFWFLLLPLIRFGIREIHFLENLYLTKISMCV